MFYAKILHHNFIVTIYENFKSIFYSSRVNVILGHCFFVQNYCVRGIIFISLSAAMKELLQTVYFEFPNALNLSCTWVKKAISCWWNTLTFQHNFAYIVNSFVVSLDVALMVNILQGII